MGEFKNWHEDEVGPDYLKQSPRTETMFQSLGDEQKDHVILVVAAQFGPRHRGRSARRARDAMSLNEFGLGAFAVGVMLLTHPSRLTKYDDLYIDCAGDEYAPDGDGLISQVPVFHFAFDRVGFDAGWFDNVHNRFGSVSLSGLARRRCCPNILPSRRCARAFLSDGCRRGLGRGDIQPVQHGPVLLSANLCASIGMVR